MNKKILSTVMAGTMLATSVAPVLAIEEENGIKEITMSKNHKASINALINVMTKTAFANESINEHLKNGNVYTIKDSSNNNISADTAVKGSVDFLEKKVREKIENAKNGDTIELISRGYVKNQNKYYHFYLEDTPQYRNYTEESLKKEFEEYDESKYPCVESMSLSKDEKVLTVIVNNKEKTKIECKVGDRDLDFTRGLDANGNVIKSGDDVNNFKKFDDKIVTIIPSIDINGEIMKKLQAKVWNEDIKFSMPIIEKDGKKYYDTEHYKLELQNGKKFSSVSEEEQKKGNFEQSQDNTVRTYSIKAFDGKVPDLANPVLDNGGNINTFNIYEKEEFLGQKGSEIKESVVAEIKINEDEVPENQAVDPGFNDFLPPAKPDNKPDGGDDSDNNKPGGGGSSNIVIPPIKPDNKPIVKPVETIAGSDRYDTAVEVAEQIAPAKEIAENGSVVLVNGNSLVDGLAAAPLAASVSHTSKVKAAPILLTKADKLTSSTKEYIEELVSKNNSSSKLKVYIVGGEAVVSKSIEKELNDLGVEVVRASGKDREATSLEVANLISKKSSISNAFVVGANGEADAMSIASVAASKKQPIIVSNFGGISKKAINEISSYEANATIIGGDEAVSTESEKSLTSSKIDTIRISGSDRQDTNAKIISKYSNNNINKVLISKDGYGKKDELVDALTSTSLAVKYNAPIVLATDKISDGQVKAIKDNASLKGISISKIGYGVANKVVDTISEVVGLIK